MKQTISFTFLIVICLQIQTYWCWSISILPTYYPYKQFTIQKENDFDEYCACYGVWSKYVPLSNIVQTGEYGILDSSCYHQFRIQEKIENNLYFLYFECISLEEKIVKKYFQFLDSENRVTTEQISMDLISYEGVWYFQGFLARPLEKRVTILIKEFIQNQIFSKDIEIRFPFKEQNFIQIIGGDFNVEQTSKFYLFENEILSYFPGQINYLKDCSYSRPDYFLQLIQSRSQKPCNCQNNQITDLLDVKIQNQDIYEFLSQNTNCQQFLLAGWIKILEINNISNEFQFQLFKLLGNFQHPQLTQENLCAFQLFYKLSTQINQIIITTYSYTLPVVNIDFSTNPYLKKKEFDVTSDIQLWHYLLVEKSDSFISISITFYQGYNQEKFSFTLEVVQFQMIQFKLLYGNILQSKSNYLTIQLTSLQLFNCPDFNNIQISCHPTCKECDGPTKDDCLSCYEFSNRKYISEFKVCVCEYGSIDQNNECVNYQTLQLNKIEVQQFETQCQYGFFEIDDECYKCPSIITNNVITCLECILNPKSWIQTLLCQTSLLVPQNGSVTKYFQDQNLQYIFAGDELKYCPNCDLNLKAPYDLIEASLIFKNFCIASQSINDNCYLCINDCKRCAIFSTNELCLDRTPNISFQNKTCYAPNYLNFYKKCVTCKLKNCLYCFDYLASDLTKSTLGNLESFSLNDEEIKLGCAQCIEGYVFEFKTSTCINQKPSQQNCLRSYINLDDKEICTLSNDFTISLEKINCQDLILHCKQCIKTIQTTIKCVLCEDGYIVSSITGICSICPILNSKQCQQDNLLEPGKWKYQGFVIQFLPQKTRLNYDLSRSYSMVVECLQGYGMIENECNEYCDEFCSVCETVKELEISSFQCSICKRNYYKELIRVQVDRKCIECPSLCQVCQNRSTDEINQINPYFILDTENSIYSFRCLKKVPFDNKIHIDPILAIAQYCYQDNCNYKLEFYYGEVECLRLHTVSDIQYNYKYFNEIGLKHITITINLEFNCKFYGGEYILINYFKENIFSIRLSELIMLGSINPIILVRKINFQIEKYDQIVISNAIFLIQTEMGLIMTNRGQSINFYILNSKFQTDKSYPIKISIKADSFHQFNMQNFTISDITIGNSIVFDIFCLGLNEDIMINNIILQDCKIINSTLFYFQNAQSNIFIKNFTIDSCIFENSSIFIFQMDQNSISNVFLNELVISNCLFQNSKLIYSPDKTTLNINKLSILNNQMLNSQFIVFNYNFYCNDIIIIDNNFLQTQLIAQIQSMLSIKEIQMKNLYVKKNQLTNCSLFITQQQQLFNNIDFLLLNFYFEDNTPSCGDENILITINCFSLLIKNIFLKNTKNYRFLNLLDIPQIQIDNLVYENQLQEYKVPYQFDCLRICVPQSQLLYIFGFNRVIIQNLQVKNQFSVDLSLISIYSNPLNTSNQNEFIFIENSIMKGNILLKQNLGILFSLMEFYSKNSLIIEITNLNFEENIFHQYQTDPSQTQASLMYFDTKQSIILLKNIVCIYNSMTNSSQSFFSISSDEVQLENITIYNHNWLGKEFWIKYYDVQFLGEYNQNEISYAIQQSYQIQNIGGIFSMFVTKFTINKGLFTYILAESNFIFNINLQGEGMGIIGNCTIIHAQNSLISNSENDGAITINGRKSLLKIKIENITFQHVYNKLSSSIFSIYPSLKQNNIRLKNIIVNNCFSLVNSIINFQSEFQNAKNNKFFIENLNVVQNESALMIFLNSIGKISSLELQKVVDDNAMMNFLGCQIQLIGLRIEGIILSSIIKIRDSNSIKLGNSQFVFISTFYPLNLIDIQQNNILQSTMTFNNIIISNQADFKYQNLTKNITFQMQDHISLKFVFCNINNQQIIQQIKKQEFVDTFFDEIITRSNNNGSFIRIKSITNLTRALLTKIIIFNNICNHCWNGLLYFDIINVEKIHVSELYCMKNKIKQYGCIAAKSTDNLEGKMLIDQSAFISNDGSLGSAIYVQNLRIYISNSKIIQNTASQKGGGIYFELSDYKFKISSTAICNNKAEEVGGLYLSGNNRLNQNNFIQSLLILNQAQQFSNNLNESPSRLSLFLNHIEMVSEQKTIEYHPVQLLILKPFKIISQDRLIYTQFLLVPSGQQISKYQLYNPKLQNYQSYIHNLRILFKNSMNEQQNNFLNTSCNIIQQIFDIQLQQVIESTQISKINFENETKSFNLGLLDFIMDPFEQDDKIQEILINCKTNYNDEYVAYLMRVKAFLCQLGEFYISSSCQKCQSEQGFYSVTYNTTKCSIFDKNKFEAITSNKILLKIGYWRPHYTSDDVELCYKNQYLCQGGWGVNNELCFKGHLGGLCEECDRFNIRGDGQFFKNQQSVECEQCQDTTKRLIAFFLISIWAILSTLLTIGSIEKSNILFAQLKLRQKFAHILFKLNQDHESILFKLFLNYLWIFSLIFTFNIKLTISLGIFKQSNDTSYFMTNFFECFLSEIQEIELIYSRIIVMLVLMICQVLVIFIGFKFVSIIKKTKFKSLIISITILQMYVQNYASLLNQFFSILVVRQISNINYISGDVSLLYGSKSHKSWIYGFSIPGSCLIGLILPLLIFLILYIKRDQHDKIKFRRHLGYLFNEYTQNNYFWEIIKLWKKTIIILILIYFQTDIFFKAQLLSLCLLFYQLIAYKYQPYILKKLNQLDNQSVQFCLIAIFLAVLKYISEQKENHNISAIIQAFIIIDSIILSYPFIMNILNKYIIKYKVKVISLLIHIFSAIKPNFVITNFLRNRLNQLRQKEEKAKQNIGKITKILFKKNNFLRKQTKLISNKQENQYIQLTVWTNFDKEI